VTGKGYRDGAASIAIGVLLATGGDVEDAASAVERRLRERHPEVRHVFLDPTDSDEVRE
jgi:hypothetical protein